MQTERRLGDQAERAVGAGEQLAEVVAGDVLHDLAAGLGDGAVGPDHGDADEQVARRAVAEAQRACGAGRDQRRRSSPLIGGSRASRWPAWPARVARSSSADRRPAR